MWQDIKNVYHLGNAFLANVWFGFPSKHLTVIGVTGTDGKTTTTSLIYHILHTGGYNASMISSVGAIIGEKDYDVGFHVTTPSPWALQRFIKKTVEVCSKYLVLETTSHALDQYRVWGIKFDVGVLTNITHEHLDYHKTYENYVNTKTKLLKMSRVAIANIDDKSYNLVSSKLKTQSAKPPASQKLQRGEQLKCQNVITYGMGRNADVNPETFPFKTDLIGEFNKYNVLAGIAVCRNLGIADKTIREAILTFKPPAGRQDIIYKNNFMVMIDFAHTPNAFEVVMAPLRAMVKGKIIHVFGSAGERDRTKRPIMGKVSSKYADIIILTSEDPRSESVEKIMQDIESGVMNHELGIDLFKIPDRKEAIESAIEMVVRGDMVLITGKSHEKSMNYGKKEIPWDEYGVVRRALKLRKIKL